MGGSAVDSPLPAPTGSDKVGRRLLYWTDESRADPGSPNGHRELAVWIYYPASPKKGAAHAQGLRGKGADAFWSSFVTSYPDAVQNGKTYPGRDIATHAYADAPLKSGLRSYQVALFARGPAMNVLQYASLLEDLASRGYIVVAVDPTYYTGFGVLSDGRVPEDRIAPTAVNGANGMDRVVQARSIIVDDLNFTLRQLAKLAADAGPFRSRLELQHVGVLGHSIGGSVAVHVAEENSSVAVAVDIEGTPAPWEPFPAKPLLILNSASGVLTAGSSFALAARAAKPGYQMVVGETTHNFPADMGFMPFLPASARNLVQEQLKVPDDVSGPGSNSGPMAGSPMSGSNGVPVPAGTPQDSNHPAPTGITQGRMLAPAGADGRPHGQSFAVRTPAVGSAHPARSLAVSEAYIEAFFDEYLKSKPTTLFDSPSPNYPEMSFYEAP